MTEIKDAVKFKPLMCGLTDFQVRQDVKRYYITVLDFLMLITPSLNGYVKLKHIFHFLKISDKKILA